MRLILLTLLILVAPVISHAESGSAGDAPTGVGYLAKADGTKIYKDSKGDKTAATVALDFPMIAFEGRSEWLGGLIASESIENGRAHVRFWKNGRDSKAGQITAWVDLQDVERFQFDCCDDTSRCSGIKDSIFKTGTYTDCFTRATAAVIAKRTAPAGGEPAAAGNGGAELEKLRLQLEIEKIRLEQQKLKVEEERLKAEQERLKAGNK